MEPQFDSRDLERNPDLRCVDCRIQQADVHYRRSYRVSLCDTCYTIWRDQEWE